MLTPEQIRRRAINRYETFYAHYARTNRSFRWPFLAQVFQDHPTSGAIVWPSKHYKKVLRSRSASGTQSVGRSGIFGELERKKSRARLVSSHERLSPFLDKTAEVEQFELDCQLIVSAVQSSYHGCKQNRSKSSLMLELGRDSSVSRFTSKKTRNLTATCVNFQ